MPDKSKEKDLKGGAGIMGSFSNQNIITSNQGGSSFSTSNSNFNIRKAWKNTDPSYDIAAGHD